MSKDDRYLTTFGGLLAFLYLAFGVFEAIGGIGYDGEWLGALCVQGNVMDAFVLLVIGAVFAFGLRERRDGSAFMLMGMALGIVFLAIYLVLMGANALGLLIFGSEHMDGWTAMDSMRPGLYLGIIAAVGGCIWRRRLSPSRLSRAGA